jgi:predicted AlkP superfamily phosphohydrolase/phosphomutase
MGGHWVETGMRGGGAGAERGMEERMPSKVMVIGLDGATFTLLKPWMEQGRLPFFRSLMEDGVSGPLRSCIPPVTAPAWQCFMTGKNPGKLGIAGFLQTKPHSYEEVPISATSCTARTLWELLNLDGKRLAVLNVPYSAAPPHFNGILIGGFDIPPSRMAEAVYPPGLLQEIERQFGEYRVYLKMPQWIAPLLSIHRFEFAIDAFLRDCQELTDYQFRVAYHLIGRDQFDLVMFYQLVPDRIQHLLWYTIDPTHLWHDAAAHSRFRETIEGYFQKLDAQLAELVRLLGQDVVVIVVSDHGFGPVLRGIDLNSWLVQEGYLHIKDRPWSQVKRQLWKLGWGPYSLLGPLLKHPLRWPFVQKRILQRFNVQRPFHGWDRLLRVMNRLFLSAADIDWPKTKAYCLSEFGMLRLNVQGREPQGAVPPEHYQAVRDELVAKLQGLVDPVTNRRVVGQIFTKEQAYHGKYVDVMPDIAYLPFASEYLAVNPTTFLTGRVFIDNIGVSGFHRLDGILLACGPGLKKGVTIEGATLFDLAPTILHLMGGRVPDDMDGRVLTELYEEPFLKAHPIVYTEALAETDGEAIDLSQEDQESVLERLKGLGYID